MPDSKISALPLQSEFDAQGADTDFLEVSEKQGGGGYVSKKTVLSLLKAKLGLDQYQPLDSDLTAIAVLSTTSFGRAFLAMADEAAFKAAVNLEAGTDFATPAALAAHEADTTGIHGISDTAQIALRNAANTFTQNLGIVRTSSDAIFDLDSPAGTNREHRFFSGGVLRFLFRINDAAETGSNAGSDLEISRRSDTGAALGSIRYVRATGNFSIDAGLPDKKFDVGGSIKYSGSLFPTEITIAALPASGTVGETRAVSNESTYGRCDVRWNGSNWIVVGSNNAVAA